MDYIRKLIIVIFIITLSFINIYIGMLVGLMIIVYYEYKHYKHYKHSELEYDIPNVNKKNTITYLPNVAHNTRITTKDAGVYRYIEEAKSRICSSFIR